MRILILNPNTTEAVTSLMLDAGPRSRRRRVSNSRAITAPRGFPYIATRAEAQIGGAIALEMLAETQGGFDAAIIAAFGDPGLLRRARTVRLSGDRHIGSRDADGLHARRPVSRRHLRERALRLVSRLRRDAPARGALRRRRRARPQLRLARRCARDELAGAGRRSPTRRSPIATPTLRSSPARRSPGSRRERATSSPCRSSTRSPPR